MKKPKDLQLLKSSTIKIAYDETGRVSKFHQKVNGEERVYDAKDVIHLSTVNIGGDSDVTIGNNWTVSVSGDVTIESTGTVTVVGSTINLN